jgi:hypothetical protein
LGVGSEYNWMRSGCRGGHLLVMAKADRSFIAGAPILLNDAPRFAGEPRL